MFDRVRIQHKKPKTSFNAPAAFDRERIQQNKESKTSFNGPIQVVFKFLKLSFASSIKAWLCNYAILRVYENECVLSALCVCTLSALRICALSAFCCVGLMRFEWIFWVHPDISLGVRFGIWWAHLQFHFIWNCSKSGISGCNLYYWWYCLRGFVCLFSGVSIS